MVNLKSLPHSIKLMINSSVLAANTILLAPALYSMAIIRLIPSHSIQHKSRQWAARIAEAWIANNNAAFALTQNTQYDIRGLEQLDASKSYLLVSNRQSWTDIMVLQKVLNRRVPFSRFFIKQELIYVPIIGIAWWILDFPFMKRYSKKTLARHPELKGKDKQTTIDRCKKLKGLPVTIMNFLEGTRFTVEKHQAQQSPYQHLLKPRAAGASYALNILSELNQLLNVTIIYPEGHLGYSDFLSGRTPKIIIDVRVEEIPDHLRQGDYELDIEYKAQFQDWMNQLWQQKDQLISAILKHP